MAQTIELAQTGKRDYLKELESKYQRRWEEEKVFEVSAPSPEEIAGLSPAEVQQKFPKWFGNFPIPYMNGSLHLGHAFTISKIEFAAGYQRMLGKRVLFPHGFHVTGMPIKAASDKIIRELELFGQNFENYEPPVEAEDLTPGSATAAVSADKSKAKKGKLQAKSTGHTYQFQILESIGVPREEIKNFADPMHWLTYFPPIAMADNRSIGTRIDWRRSWLTTPANPFFDSFVKWQMRKLKEAGKIKFGKRYTIYCIKDNQPCMDHDRSEGEGVGPQEYTGIKMEVVEWSPAAQQAIADKVGGRKVYLVAATLRPETMYGQTNCFVGPSLKYGVYAVNDKEAYVCTLRAARNMAYQDIITPTGNIQELASLDGSDIIGTKIKAPFSVNPEVYVLPMETVLATKGTGVVTSVPSDSPDDYITLMDLRKKAEYYKLNPTWMQYDPVPILTTPTYGDMTAEVLVKKLKINSPKDTKQLVEAKELAYKEGFYSGTMLIGEFKGQKVEDAKQLVKDSMIKAGLAFAYAEPEGLVISRSSDECIVSLMEQWYIDYGEATWRALTEKVLAKMSTNSDETRNAFEGALRWLNQWACARTYGLGSELPWDTQFLVESLSDTTMYMCYYTIAHLLHENDIEASKPGPLGITAEQMTDAIWDYVFLRGPFPTNSPVAKEKVDALKHEYEYFYPFDLRSSAKDLVPNNLTFILYVHAALFPEDKWPLAMRLNGHLMLNGKKMSKSTGNSLTLREAVEKFGADATRLSLADAGDGIEDANFEEKTANANILRIHTLLSWCEEILQDRSKLRTGPKDSFHDKVFEEEINDLINISKGHYEDSNYKDALKYCFYEFQAARDQYREVTADIGMHADLVEYWIRNAALLITPIAPHFAEHIWSDILKSPETIQRALWPTPSNPVDRSTIEAATYMRGTIKSIRDGEAMLLKKMSKLKGKGQPPFDPKQPKAVNLFVATSFPEWQDKCVQIVKDAYSAETDTVDDSKIREVLSKDDTLKKNKLAMPFMQLFKKRIAQFGADTAFNRALPFSEIEVVNEYLPYIKRTLNLVDAAVYTVEESLAKDGQQGFAKSIIESSEPGAPSFEYYNVNAN